MDFKLKDAVPLLNPSVALGVIQMLLAAKCPYGETIVLPRALLSKARKDIQDKNFDEMLMPAVVFRDGNVILGWVPREVLKAAESAEDAPKTPPKPRLDF